MPTHCPVCHREAIACIDTHTSRNISLACLHRHVDRGRVYLHEGNHEPRV